MDNTKRLERQTKTNVENLAENVSDNAKRLGDQTETNVIVLGQRAKRDAENFIRWVREETCDRVRRKDGPEAGRRCEEEMKRRQQSSGPGSAQTEQFYASKETECLNPDGSTWGSSGIGTWGKSPEDARRKVDEIIRGYGGRVCAIRWHDDRLTDGDARWTTW